MSELPDLQLLPAGVLNLPAEVDLAPRYRRAFEGSSAEGILAIATEGALDEAAPAALRFWAGYGREYLTRLARSLPNANDWESVPLPDYAVLEQMQASAPLAAGMEYLSIELLSRLWIAIDEEAARQVSETPDGLEAWLKKRHPLWRLVGRVTFHLAENARNEQFPFAFLATYTHRLSAQSQLQYLPLGRALKQYAEANDTRTLQTLLKPVQRAADLNAFARDLLESRQVFQAVPWRPTQAYQFLEAVPAFEEAGIITKAPDWWQEGRPSRPVVQVTLDAQKKSTLGTGALLSFSIDVALNGEKLSPKEWQRLLDGTEDLISLKGHWVEVDREKLEQALEAWKIAERAAVSEGIPFLEGMRLLAGFGEMGSGSGIDASLLEGGGDWTQVVAGDRLRSALAQMLSPEQIEPVSLSHDELRAELRPYQQNGLNWLLFLARLGIGACLADDMGLGKTIQVIAALVTLNRERLDRSSLLVVPASLIGNWASELEKFAPQLRVRLAHPSHGDVTPFTRDTPPELHDFDLVITTYSMLQRLPGLSMVPWHWLILDEAQAIKNPATAQTRAVKALDARQRIALTGTPIENNVTDLWSLFDFLNPGLLGTSSRFKEAMKMASNYEGLRRLVKPYILRRLKTDPKIIRDLPDKTEIRTTCFLSKSQAALYEQSVRQMAEDLKAPNLPEIERKGVVVSTLIRLKQICNHPGLITGSGNFEEQYSGKMRRLGTLAEEIASRGEKLIVFSQFREMVGPLTDFLERVFGQPGLLLHGGTAVGRRQKLVEQFQSPTGAPFFVISLKAGGTGLNLTAANHVVHFDRWWNPAVENQATDRAYRIGQQRNVLVHKFVIPGTIEEKIDQMIDEKQQIADDIIGDPDDESTHRQLIEMGAAELIRFVSLDVRSAVE